jgi:putative restriction endonuclease
MKPGHANHHGQQILRCTELPGPDPASQLWVLECDHCGHVYACDSTSAPYTKCRRCQHGPIGLPVPTERDTEPWTRDDHILTFTLYNQIPFGAIARNPEVINLAALLARSVASVHDKLATFARLDPVLQSRIIPRPAHQLTPEEQILNEFTLQPEAVAYESAQLLARRLGQPLARTAEIDDSDLPPPGPDRDALLRLRVTQSFFRRRVLSAYNFRCCVTGLRQLELLVASHIVPCATDPANRLNPRNGLCLNALHARVFDRGLMWIDDHFLIRFSPKLRQDPRYPDPTLTWITSFVGKPLQLPATFSPDPDLLRRHSQPFRPQKAIQSSVAPWGPI